MARKILKSFLITLLLFWGPWLYLRYTTPLLMPSEVASSEAALIFGAIVRNDQISPLHAERLDAAIYLYENRKIEKIIVSNAKSAAGTMRRYLISQGIPEQIIEMDIQAIRTPDSCIHENAIGNGRSVIFISQKFHLPRIALHCAPYEFEKQYLIADSPTRAQSSIGQKLRIRTARYIREAALSWSILLRLYPEQSD